MAESEGTHKRKSYLKSKIPVATTEYKGRIRNIKAKRILIEEKETEVENLKLEFERLKIDKELEQEAEEQEQPFPLEVEESTLLGHSGEIRTLIRTPGGTKRKVKPSHLQFRFKLEEALSNVLEQRENASVKATDLIDKLRRLYPASSHIDRRKILKTTSELYGIKLKQKGKKKEGYYSGLALKIHSDVGDISESVPAESTEDFGVRSPVAKSCNVSEGSAVASSPPAPEHRSISCRGKLEFLGTSNESEVDELKAKVKVLEDQLNDLQETSSKLVNSQSEVIDLYKELLGDGRGLGGVLTLTERSRIEEEISKLKNHLNLGLRKKEVKDIATVIHPLLFAGLVQKMKDDCPTITNIIEQLVLSRNASRNVRKTETVKMRAGVHLLSSLMDVRDQRGQNDIQLLFGLLCVSYGARCSMIEVLQHIGLTESYPVICGVLKKQLEHYRAIIKERVSLDCPVVTYEDNMQLQRTSMRHLRLSKLQKDKKKQEKVWDFTVRGWRVADISGLEELFKDPASAKESQKNVADLEFESLNIECHEHQYKRWLDFKERNILRKMDLALNQVQLSFEQLKGAASEELKNVSDGSDMPRRYCVEVPEVPDDFTDRTISKSMIYPLPISIENQCTTLGTASNLDKFQDEFGFANGNESNQKFLPVKKGTREYNLDLAYSRFSFLKSMEIHKQDQLDYEQHLRKTADQSFHSELS